MVASSSSRTRRSRRRSSGNDDALATVDHDGVGPSVPGDVGEIGTDVAIEGFGRERFVAREIGPRRAANDDALPGIHDDGVSACGSRPWKLWREAAVSRIRILLLHDKAANTDF